MSPRRNWDSPNPSPASECAPPPGLKGGGGHTRLRLRGQGSPNSISTTENKLSALPTPTRHAMAARTLYIRVL